MAYEQGFQSKAIQNSYGDSNNKKSNLQPHIAKQKYEDMFYRTIKENNTTVYYTDNGNYSDKRSHSHYNEKVKSGDVLFAFNQESKFKQTKKK